MSREQYLRSQENCLISAASEQPKNFDFLRGVNFMIES
jgi:hypothetical protein